MLPAVVVFTRQSYLEAYKKTTTHVLDNELPECVGFLTSTGRYVCRKGALIIAAATIQPTGKQPADTAQLRSKYLVK